MNASRIASASRWNFGFTVSMWLRATPNTITLPSTRTGCASWIDARSERGRASSTPAHATIASSRSNVDLDRRCVGGGRGARRSRRLAARAAAARRRRDRRPCAARRAPAACRRPASRRAPAPVRPRLVGQRRRVLARRRDPVAADGDFGAEPRGGRRASRAGGVRTGGAGTAPPSARRASSRSRRSDERLDRRRSTRAGRGARARSRARGADRRPRCRACRRPPDRASPSSARARRCRARRRPRAGRACTSSGSSTRDPAAAGDEQERVAQRGEEPSAIWRGSCAASSSAAVPVSTPATSDAAIASRTPIRSSNGAPPSSGLDRGDRDRAAGGEARVEQRLESRAEPPAARAMIGERVGLELDPLVVEHRRRAGR